MSTTLTPVYLTSKLVTLDRVRRNLQTSSSSLSTRSSKKASESSPLSSIEGFLQYEDSGNSKDKFVSDEQLIARVNARDWTQASNILESMLSCSTQLDSDIIDRVLIGLCKKQKSRKAIQLYTKVMSEEISLSYFAYHSLFQAALKESAFHVVRSLHKDMNKDGHLMNPITCSMVITGLLRNKRKGTGNRRLAYEIWSNAQKTSKEFDSGLFRAGCGACVSLRKMREAEELIPIMRQKGLRPDVKFYNILIKGYCQMKTMKSALNCVELMKRDDIQPDIFTYNTLIHGFVLCKELERAESFLKLAINEGFRPDVCTYTTLIDGFLQRKQLRKAKELYKDFRVAGGKPNKVMHSMFINSYINQKKLPLAYKQLAVMKSEGLKPNLVTYNTLLKGYAAQGTSACYPQIIKIFSEMKSNGVKPGVDTFNTLLSGLMESQDLDSIQKLVQVMLQLGLQPDGVSYNYLMKINRDKFEEIFEEINNFDDIVVDLACWNLLVALFSQCRNFTKAEIALQGAVDYAIEHHLEVPVEAFGAIIKGYIKSNNLPAAIQKFRWFCKLGGHPDLKMIEELLSACITKGDVHHALKLLRASKFLDKALDLEKYRRLILRIERNGIPSKKQQEIDQEDNDDGIETLKFWLGIPNSHYSSDWP